MDEWIYFLKNEKIEDGFTAKGLEQAQETLDVLKMSAQERQAYEHHQTQLHHEASLYESTYVLGKIEGREEGKIEGREEGLEEGKRQSVLIMAKNMKQAGIDVKTIAKVTGLTIE